MIAFANSVSPISNLGTPTANSKATSRFLSANPKSISFIVIDDAAIKIIAKEVAVMIDSFIVDKFTRNDAVKIVVATMKNHV